MKLDKDALLKQKFWLLLGAFAVLWLLSLAILAFAGSPADAAQTAYKSAKDEIAKYPHPKNDSFLLPWQDYAGLFKKHKNTVWKVAWDGDEVKDDKPLGPGEKRWEGQKEMYTWPSNDQHPLQTLLTYPDVPIDVSHREWYKTDEVYKQQFNDLYFRLKTDPKQLDPDKPPPCRPLDGVAFTHTEDYYGVMNPVNWTTTPRPPDAEECWLAQEDFWVKRELLNVVADALSTASRMEPADGEIKDEPDKKFAGRRVFRNASWRVELLFERTDNGLRVSPESKIKNVHVSYRDQDLGSPRSPKGVWFLLRQGGQSWLVAFEGERVPYDGERVMGKGLHKDGFSVPGADPSQPMTLDQVFDATNTPITEIDAIAIPKVSHKQANRPLQAEKPDHYGKKETAAPTTPGAPPVPGAPAPVGAAPPPGGTGNMPAANTGSPGGPGMGNPTSGSPANLTANKFFDRNRYLFVAEQSRHLPVAMTLTVDQSHLHEILVALANSRLRFQTTQVEFRRVPSAGSASTQPGVSTPSSFGPPSASSSGSPVGTSREGPPGMLLPGASSGTGTPPPVVDNPNLLEVTIYGIASLYERPR